MGILVCGLNGAVKSTLGRMPAEENVDYLLMVLQKKRETEET